MKSFIEVTRALADLLRAAAFAAWVVHILLT
jgi:hypothetical protein